MGEPEADILREFVEDLRCHGVLPIPQPWQDAFEGKISVEEAAALRRKYETADELEANKHLFRPPSELELQRLLARMAPAKRRLWLLLAPLATAAAVLLLWRTPREVPPLPDYLAMCHSCARASRSADAPPRHDPRGAPQRHNLDGEVDWEISPLHDDPNGAVLHIFTAEPGQPWHRLDAERFVSAEQGHFRIRAEHLRDIIGAGRPGELELLFVVERPDTLEPSTPPACEPAERVRCPRLSISLYKAEP